MILQKKNKTKQNKGGAGFALFQSIFLRINLCVTLDDLTVKNTKLGEEICIWLKINKVEN